MEFIKYGNLGPDPSKIEDFEYFYSHEKQVFMNIDMKNHCHVRDGFVLTSSLNQVHILCLCDSKLLRET